MNSVRKFLELRPSDKWLILKALSLVGLIRFLLWISPFPMVRPLLDRVSRRSERLTQDQTPAERFAWAIVAASGVVPGGGHCLTQAFALQAFLSRRGRLSRIRFGVQRVPGLPFQAHAWVEHQGVVLIGNTHLERFVALSTSSEFTC